VGRGRWAVVPGPLAGCQAPQPVEIKPRAVGRGSRTVAGES